MTPPPDVAPAARANASGGSAAAGGMNFQARVTTIAAVHLLGRRPLGWLKELELDTPSEVWCETNGPGDDVRLVLTSGLVVEAQAKKGLRRGTDLWSALQALASGINDQSIAYGVLIVDNGTSDSIRSDLALGIRRLGDGRTDGLDDITSEFKRRLEESGLPMQPTCRRLRIVVLHCADHDDASETAAKSELARLCAAEHDVVAAWQALQTSAHGLIQRRGRWTAESVIGVLRSASIDLIPTPPDVSSAAPAGLAWHRIGEVSPHRGLVLAFRQHYLTSGQAAAPPFGGRDDEYDRLDAWLSDSAAPNRMLISGPTARGKSALLVHWTERLASDATWSVVYVPISLRFNTDRPAVFYAVLATQLANVLNRKLVPPAMDPESYYQGNSADLLHTVANQTSHILVVVDGLDEAQGTGFNPAVFPSALPPNVKILVSARQQAGDTGPVGWLARLDWQGVGQATAEDLALLGRKAVTPILESVGISGAALTDALIDRLVVLTAGEPLLLALYADDLRAAVVGGAHVLVDALEGMSPGFAAYFSRAFNAQQWAWAQSDPDSIDMTLAVLAAALGPIQGSHLTDLVCDLRNIARPASSDRFIRPLARFVAGDGSADRGYVLNHPKLGEYLREERFDSTTLQSVQRAFVAWGRRMTRALVADPSTLAPGYVLRHHVDHLRQLSDATLDDVELVLSDGWRLAWSRLDTDLIGYAGSLTAMLAAMQPSGTYAGQASRALRLRIRIALCVSSVKSQGTTIPSELLAMGLGEGLITLRQAINVAELQSPDNRLGYLAGIAPNLPTEERLQLATEISHVTDTGNRTGLLAQLVPVLPQSQRSQAIDSILGWLEVAANPLQRISTFAALAPALSDAQLSSLLADALSATLSADEAPSAAILIAPVIATQKQRLTTELHEVAIARCLHWIEIAGDAPLAVQALGELATLVTADKLDAQIARLLPLVGAIRVSAPLSMPDGIRTFELAMQQTRRSAALATLEILAIRNLPPDSYQLRLASALAPLLAESLYWEIHPLVRILPLIQTDAQHGIAMRCYQLACQLPTANNRTHALMPLAKAVTSPLRLTFVREGLVNARFIEDEYSRCLTLVALFATLPAKGKEESIAALLLDINQIGYVLHRGQVLLDLAKHMPRMSELADKGLRLIRMAEDTGNRVSTLLREIPALPQLMREGVFRECLQQILGQSDVTSRIHISMAARYASDYWTATDLQAARRTLDGAARSFERAHALVGLLPVAARLGAQDIVDDAFDEISRQEDPNGRLSHMVHAATFVPVGDPRRDWLNQSWHQAASSSSLRISTLIDGYEVMDAADQVVAWPLLKVRAIASPEAGRSLARLSTITTSHLERAELLRAALSACASSNAEERVPAAANIALACRTREDQFQAFDLMTATPSVSRNTLLSAVRIAGPVLAEAGASSLTLALMGDVRECSAWWP